MRDVEIMREQYARRAGKGSAQRKRHYLVFGSVDAHGIRCNFVLADSKAAAPVGRIFKVFDKEDYENHNPEHPGESGKTGDAHQTDE